jgi:hypothetical protein
VKVGDRKFLLGRCLVTPVSRNEKILALLDGLLLNVSGSDACGAGTRTEDLVELDVDLDTLMNIEGNQAPMPDSQSEDSLEHLAGETIRLLLSQAMAEHKSVIWLDAAVLVPPGGDLFLLAGPSMAGKTTLTLAMCLGHRWHALSEDMTLIDQQNCRVLSFARPSSMRRGCLEIIENAIGQPVKPCHLKEWFFRPEMFLNGIRPAKFSAVLKLAPIEEGRREDMVLEAQSPAEMVRALLPLSNCLRLPGAVQFMHEATATARCYNLSGGSLIERMRTLLDVAGSQ